MALLLVFLAVSGGAFVGVQVRGRLSRRLRPGGRRARILEAVETGDRPVRSPSSAGYNAPSCGC